LLSQVSTERISMTFDAEFFYRFTSNIFSDLMAGSYEQYSSDAGS
jgi:hypothetical protein